MTGRTAALSSRAHFQPAPDAALCIRRTGGPRGLAGAMHVWEPMESSPLAAPTRMLHLQDEAASLWPPARGAPGGHSARTLAKLPDLRVVLLVLREGARIPEHRADADLALQVLRGRVQLDVAGQRVALEPGALLTLARGLPHDVAALEDAELLLTLSGPQR